MKWFVVESTMDGTPKCRYTVNAEYMKVDGELVVFYADKFSHNPSRVLRLEPGQIAFEASEKQCDSINESLAHAEAVVPKGVVQ